MLAMTRARAVWLVASAMFAAPLEQSFAQRVDWPHPSGDAGAMRWSPLPDIDRGNVARLAIAWTWKTNEKNVRASGAQRAARPGQFQVSPVVIGDTMYLS